MVTPHCCLARLLPDLHKTWGPSRPSIRVTHHPLCGSSYRVHELHIYCPWHKTSVTKTTWLGLGSNWWHLASNRMGIPWDSFKPGESCVCDPLLNPPTLSLWLRPLEYLTYAICSSPLILMGASLHYSCIKPVHPEHLWLTPKGTLLMKWDIKGPWQNVDIWQGGHASRPLQLLICFINWLTVN